MGTVGSYDQSYKDKMKSLVIACLVMGATQAHALNKRSVVHAVPVVSTPAEATAGYAVGASGAVGGQTPATIAAAAPVVAYAGALPVAHHSAVAIASHAIPAAHHSVPIVPLTHPTLANIVPHSTLATAHPHGFSYGFTSFLPSIWPSTTVNTIDPKTYSAPDISLPENGVGDVVDLRDAGRSSRALNEVASHHLASHHLGKRDAGYLGSHGGYLGGYLGHHGGHVLGLKSAPCVNVNNVPVPCASGGLYHHGHLGYLG